MIDLTDNSKMTWAINTECGRRMLPEGWKLACMDNKMPHKLGQSFVGILTHERRYTYPDIHAIYYGDDLLPMWEAAVEFIKGLEGWAG